MLDWARCLVVDILCAWRSPLIKWMEAPAGTLGCLAWRAPWSTEPCCFQVPCCGSLQGSERSSGWSGGPRGPITGPRPRWARACSTVQVGSAGQCCAAVLCCALECPPSCCGLGGRALLRGAVREASERGGASPCAFNSPCRWRRRNGFSGCRRGPHRALPLTDTY